MNLSGILVVTKPENVTAMKDLLNSQEGVEVHHVEEKTGRIIIVQEADTINDEVAGLRKIKKLDGVIMAEMVYHYLDGEQGEVSIPDDIDEFTGLPTDDVPAFLNE